MDQLRAAPFEASRRPPHPVIFALLIVPFGASSGFVSVALAFLATRNGLSVEQGAWLIAISMFPNVWKFFWAPIGDKTLTRKRWYLLSSVFCAVGIGDMAWVPLGAKTLPLMGLIVLLTSIAATFQGFAVEGLVAHLTPPDHRGRVSGWFQAGNLGGAGIGGGLGLWLINTLPAPWMAGVVLAFLMMSCAIPLRWVEDVPADATDETIGDAIRHLRDDLWSVLKSTKGILCAVLCFAPLGTGAAGGVLTQAEVAAHWHAGEHEVELVQGILTGVLSVVGSLAGGAACSRLFNARVGYAIFGGLMAIVTAAMAMSPATVTVYVGYSLAYAFVTGLCYAAFSAFVLDAIGTGHAATKYNGFASLSNAPITYMGLVLASAETKWGPNGMLYTESLCGVAGIVLFAVTALALRGRERPIATAAVPEPAET
jgi:hypothetical protein